MLARVLQPQDEATLRFELQAVGADKASFDLLLKKRSGVCLKLTGLRQPAAAILKQEALARGADCAVHRHVIDARIDHSDALLMGTRAQLAALGEKLQRQPFGLAEASRAIASALANAESTTWRWCTAQGELELSRKRPLVMAILNLTPDSFSGDGLAYEVEAAVAKAEEALASGADVIDIGGESTRPGSERITAEAELQWVLPVIEALAGRFEAPLSIDTYKPEVAARALDAGAAIVNCVRGLEVEGMADLIASTGAGAICMHSLWPPETMQEHPLDKEAPEVVYAYLHRRLQQLEAQGVAPEQVVVDPGLGFGKTVTANLLLLKRLGELLSLGRPVLVGASRKSFIGKLTGAEIGERLPGTLAAHTAAILAGAALIRAHDVKAAVQAAKVAAAISAGEIAPHGGEALA